MTVSTRTPVPTSWPLTGRDDELERLSAAIDDPGRRGAVLVGPAGVGKTRLARTVAELAQLRGLETVFVRASRSAARIPFAALAPLFAFLGILPEEATSPFVAVNEALAGRCADNRLVLVVDDAQELDHASVAMLDQCADRDGVFVVATVRVGEGGLDSLSELLKSERIDRVTVGALGEAAVAALVSTALAGPVDGAALAACWAASGGNVLFLRELVQGALESGALRSERGIWRLRGSLVDSPRLDEVIAHRFAGLRPGELELVRLVALGEPLSLPLLAALAETEPVEELERRGLLEVAPGPAGSELRLAHPLFGEVVRARLPVTSRARLFGRLAAAREQLGEPVGPELVRAALWRLEAGEVDALQALRAAREAFRSEDFDLASRLALASWEAGRQVDAALLLADAFDVAGRTGEVESVLLEAGRLAASDQERTAVAIRLASSLFVWRGRADEADQLLHDVALTVEDPACRRLIDTQRVDLLVLRGEAARAIELAETVLAANGEAGHAQASRDYGVALALAGRTGDALTWTASALAAVRNLDDEEQVTALAVYLVARSLACGQHGQLAEAIDIARAGYQASLDRHNLDGQAWFACVLGLNLVAAGQLGTAAHLFRETTTVFHELGHPGLRWGLGGIALAAGQRGDREAAETARNELDELDERDPPLVRMMDVHIERGRAWSMLAAGDAAAARATLWEAVALAERWGQRSAGLAALHDIVRIADDQAAVRAIEELAPGLDGELAAGRLDYARAVGRRDVALAAAAGGRFEASGALLHAAEAAALESRLADEAGDRRRASAAADRAGRLLARCEGAVSPALRLPSASVALSTRELDVARLAVEGLTSREIAARLYLSPRTVENHLQRVYVKLGVSSRTELGSHLSAG